MGNGSSNEHDSNSDTDDLEPLHSASDRSAPEWTVDKAIYEIGCGKYQYHLFIITGTIWAADAMEMMLLAFLLPELQKTWHLSGAQSSLIGVSVFIGMLLGATTLAVLSDKFGRKKIVFVGTLCTAIFGVLSGIAPNLGWMVFFRSAVGFFMTAGCVAYTLFAEFVPTENDPMPSANPSHSPLRRPRQGIMTRGKLLIFQGIFWSAGALFSVLLAWVTLKYLNWRWYLILSSLPLWIASVAVWFMQESPHYLVVSEQHDAAMNLLQYIADYNGEQLPTHWRLKHTPIESRGRLCDLFQRQYRDVTVKLYVIYSCCVFSYYGLSFLSVRYFDMLDELYHLQRELFLEMTITTFAEVPALLLGMALIDRLGRRGVMNVAFMCFAVSCYLLVLHSLQHTRVIGIALVFIARMWINLAFIGLGIYFVEFYPTYIRATALGFAISLGRFAGILTTFIAESLSITLGLYLYGCIGLVAFIASVLIKTDTKKKLMSDD
mmetsp:Transcript_10451/g.15705  ORF Transcript_10451/g.15705 Transcript_10451/m.15705 type:complete len:491 (+) Transcript_10451:28-1500(+)|eukprot:CAMPEP_0202707856 /NCGR_PEP_ID=MMETSP1385-20130828/20130_1 /ASSEMBLY_ACC=CAM_ASM_000861 /TAXON_ID=933848 /ORGANISM="Elphidium margaritaceum" /LENGTH=490 /DNA_ID=CAMNT_0049366661 /DNA_START=20 /DNA_END=1492 /DNA_ORIENTATION=-